MWRHIHRSFREAAAAGAVGGHTVWLFEVVQTEKGGVDDFVFVDQGCAGKGFALATVSVPWPREGNWRSSAAAISARNVWALAAMASGVVGLALGSRRPSSV